MGVVEVVGKGIVLLAGALASTPGGQRAGSGGVR